MNYQNPRWRVFVDRPVQGTLLFRAVAYWAMSLITQQLIVFLFVLATSSSDDLGAKGARLWWYAQLSVVAALAILPLILFDILTLSHRWVGPIFRLRASVHALSLGEVVPPIRFREGDFWQDLARDINVVTAELNCYRDVPPKGDLGTVSPLGTNAGEPGGVSHPNNDPSTPDLFRRFPGQSGAWNMPPIPLAADWSAFPTSAQ
jgi:hypothetical protein